MLTAKLNTLKTVAGYGYSLIERWLPLKLSRGSIAGIYNYLQIDDRISTSGQPTAQQLASISAAGFTAVINLAPHNVENALPNEAQSLRKIGLPYFHIPVNFNAPAEDDFTRFVAIMQDCQEQKVWVHCAANMRVSSFIYRFRCEVLGEDPAVAQISLHKIWEPIGVWQRFIDNTDKQISND